MVGLGTQPLTNAVTTDFVSVYQNNVQNAQINADGSEVFGNDHTDQEARQKHGSFNRLIIKNRSSNSVRLTLDDVRIFTEIAPSENLIIEPSDGIYFDFFKITDLTSAQINAGLITITFGRSQRMLQGVNNGTNK